MKILNIAGIKAAGPTAPEQETPDVPPHIQDIMWEVFEYANIKEGFNSLEGDARVKRRSQLFEQDAKIRRMLLNYQTQDDEPIYLVFSNDTYYDGSWEFANKDEFDKANEDDRYKLYTRPDNSKLREAAKEALKLLAKLESGYGFEDDSKYAVLENLRAALEAS